MSNENKVLTVWKFGLNPQHVNSLLVPKGGKVLSVQTQDGEPQMWILVDRHEPLEQRKFLIYGTGHSIPSENIGTFVGTFQQEAGALIFHVFEAPK